MPAQLETVSYIDGEIWKNTVSRAGKENIRKFLDQMGLSKITSECKGVFDARGFAACVYKQLKKRMLSTVINKCYIELGNFIRRARIVYYAYTDSSRLRFFFRKHVRQQAETVGKDLDGMGALPFYRQCLYTHAFLC